MAANSVDTRCPADMYMYILSAEGQYRTKRLGRKILASVCNEQVQSPEGKVCSELRRNTKRSAEMTDPTWQVFNLVSS